MAESYRAKAFDVFERLDAARKGTPGTGMGLPICKRVVEGVGGTIVEDGPQPGFATGTTLRISLLAEDDEDHAFFSSRVPRHTRRGR